MTLGLSCMNHPHAGAFPIDHPHTLATLPLVPGNAALNLAAGRPRAAQLSAAALQTERARLAMAEQASPIMDLRERLMQRHPFVLDRLRSCMYCRTELTRTVIRVMDVTFQTFEFALCKLCLNALAAFGPTRTIAHRNAPMAEPMDFAIVLRELERSLGARRRKAVQARKKRVAALPEAEADVINVNEPVLRLLRRSVLDHPQLRALMTEDGDADAVYHLNFHMARPASQQAERTALLTLAEKLNRRVRRDTHTDTTHGERS